ncbi:MAG: c-type cytochrome [Planctomycetia bacterium]|nr:c-type cytochrome [Planctomycetia bacterium]
MASSLSDTKQTGGSARPLTGRRTKIVLLTASGVTLGFLIAAMYRENFQSQWRQVQREYRHMLLQAPDERQRQLGQAFPIELRQIDLPLLGTTDRCVTCHVGLDNPAMADAPLPWRVHSGDFLKHHPVEKYGCTICHHGQGLATNFREATATDVFWDYPLLPVRLTEASCGACHAADSPLMAKHAPRLARGHQLFLDRGCQSCHKLGGVGGQLGPALDGEGLKIKHQLPMGHVKGEHTLANWLQQHFENPQLVVANSQMRPPRLSAAENEALTIYMLSLRGRDLPQNYIPADRVAAWHAELHQKVKDPVVLYNRFCVSCHGDGTFGQWDKFFLRFNPAIRGPGLRAMADKEYFRAAVEQGRPGTLMPAWGKNAGGLTPEQVTALVDYLAAGDQRPAQPLRPMLETLSGGKPERGGELFTQHCSACHAAGKVAPNLANPVFQKTASNTFIVRTIVNGRADTAMPAFQRDGCASLTDDEIRDLLSYIRSLEKKP